MEGVALVCDDASNCLYALGGMQTCPWPPQRPATFLIVVGSMMGSVYDPSWAPIAPMVSPRGFGGAAVLDGKIHAIGGTYNAPPSVSGLPEVYDPLDRPMAARGTRGNGRLFWQRLGKYGRCSIRENIFNGWLRRRVAGLPWVRPRGMAIYDGTLVVGPSAPTLTMFHALVVPVSPLIIKSTL